VWSAARSSRQGFGQTFAKVLYGIFLLGRCAVVSAVTWFGFSNLDYAVETYPRHATNVASLLPNTFVLFPVLQNELLHPFLVD
jgi:hypothetical protein